MVFKKPRGCIGFVEFKPKGRIWIAVGAKRRVSPAQIYLHECLHVLYPKRSEKWVLALERRMWRKLTNYQRYLLYHKLFAKHYRTNGGNDEG